MSGRDEQRATGRSAADDAGAAVDDDRPAVLVVDDHPDNVTVLEVILEPLDVRVLTANSGEAALRTLLGEDDVAVIVLDVRMPGMDGFETASFIKRRERSSHVPIIFLTALANDRDQALSGYEAGAVDFIEKPVEPLVLRAKVAAFVELARARREVERQAELLRAATRREATMQVEAARELGERRYRDLAEAMPAMVFSLDPSGYVDYRSPAWDEYADGAGTANVTRADDDWSMVHPADLLATQRAWADSVADPTGLAGGRLELQVRLRRRDGAYLWHMIRAVPRFDGGGACIGWVGTATEVDTTRRIAGGQRALSEVGAVLVTASDVDHALPMVAAIAVDEMVDWCSIDVVDSEGDGRAHRRAMQVDGSLEPNEASALADLLAVDGAGSPTQLVLTSDGLQRVLFAADGTQLGRGEESRASAICVPLVVRGERIGAISLANAVGDRPLGEPERVFARSLATRIASALDAARQFSRAQDRAQAAEVLDAIADGVALVDHQQVVQLWNPAAAAITGMPAQQIVGRRAVDVLPDWESLADRVPVQRGAAERSGVTTVPLAAADGRDTWLSVSAVGFARGVAYAFRDLTEERAVERMKSDFVATVSHELRTPLASIHGAAVTLTRGDIDLDEEVHAQLLDIIAQQSNQLADIVDTVLTASRLDAGQVELHARPVDAAEVARDVVDHALTRVDASRAVSLEAPDDLPPVSADRAHLRQVLENLVENAIKYSPEGGDVTVRVEEGDATLRFVVQDSGIGIPASEHRRIFDKFYRVDADMTHGIGGTGLGLFIVRELVRHMSGRIEVTSTPGSGSAFVVTLPAAHVSEPVA